MLVQIVDPASGAARVLEVIAQASLDAYAPRIQVQKSKCYATKLLFGQLLGMEHHIMLVCCLD